MANKLRSKILMLEGKFGYELIKWSIGVVGVDAQRESDYSVEIERFSFGRKSFKISWF